MIFLTIVTLVTTVKKYLVYSFIFYLLSQYFWKKQFDTFDNTCDVLRAAFYDSCDVFVCEEVT